MTAQEYLTWLLSIEHQFSNLPGGTRAYLVSIDPVANTRTLTPVGADDSVINLQTGLVKYLREEMVSTDLLHDIRRACVERLAVRGIKAEPSEEERRYAGASLADADEMLTSLGRQVRALASSIQRLLPSTPHRHPLLTGDLDHPQRLELRDGITAVQDLAITLHNIGSTITDTVPDSLNEAMKVLDLPAYQPAEAIHE